MGTSSSFKFIIFVAFHSKRLEKRIVEFLTFEGWSKSWLKKKKINGKWKKLVKCFFEKCGNLKK